MSIQLQKALSLAKKTGDRLIVFESPASARAFVIMGLEQYEDLLEGDCGADCQCGHDCCNNQADYDDLENESEPELSFDSGIDTPDYEDEDGLPEEEIVDHDLAYREEVQRLTEEELLDKINRDIALWKESQKAAENESDQVQSIENEANNSNRAETGTNRSKWAIKSEIKDNADEIIEEDRHYLEEVRY